MQAFRGEIIDNEGVRTIARPSCFLCGQEGPVLYSGQRDRLFSAPGVWSIRKCQVCEVAWLDPCPLSEEISKLYVGYYTHEVQPMASVLPGLRRYIAESIWAMWLGYREGKTGIGRAVIGRVAGLLPPIREVAMLGVMGLHAERRGRLVDVGCGNGQFLARMRSLGWEVLGVEPDSEAARVASERFGLTVIPSTLEEAKLPEASIDAITMNHVIEHVPDPISLLAECRRILRPGGTVVVVTPNLQSLGCRVFKADWRGWEVPRHLVIFSPKALRLCAERAGLTINSLRTTARSARWMWVASKSLRSSNQLSNAGTSDLTWRLRLQGMAFQVVEHLLGGQMGEELVLIATK